MSAARVCDVAIVGAGPAGATAASILSRKGYEVVVVERQIFPRFSIGESLLPQCMTFLDEAGMLPAVTEAGFQMKNGAAFDRAGTYTAFDFSDKFSEGWSTTYQVKRAAFDKILADEAARSGVAIYYDCEVSGVEFTENCVTLQLCDARGQLSSLRSRFCLDASGFGMTLSNLLGLRLPGEGPPRESIFTHVTGRFREEEFDRNKILITVHPTQPAIWFWLIPFSDGTASLGVVGPQEALADYGSAPLEALQAVVGETGRLGSLVAEADYDMPVRRVSGYASSLSRMHGPNFALLGNAAGFLDPVFSSGVTIALKSASLATKVLHRQLQGEAVDWQEDYVAPLTLGVGTFRHFVAAWYDTGLQDIIFSKSSSSRIRQMICSILAGYAWDEANPYVAQPNRRLNALVEFCRS